MFSTQLQAQLSEDARDVIEKYLENIETDGDFTQIIEDIEAYLDKPISINTASAEELMNFPLISPSEAASIVQHRITFGYFLRIDELQVIGLQPEHIRALSYFINTFINTFSNNFPLNSRFFKILYRKILTTTTWGIPFILVEQYR